MKRYLCILICMLLFLSGCGSKSDPNIGKTIFDTEKEITKIEFHTTVNNQGMITVPDEYIAEIIDWLGTLKITEKNTRGTWAPGTGSTEVTIYYADGTSHSGSISNITIGNSEYYVDGANAPDIYLSLWDNEDTENE